VAQSSAGGLLEPVPELGASGDLQGGKEEEQLRCSRRVSSRQPFLDAKSSAFPMSS